MITAIIVAAGKGERAGFSGNKILEELNGLPVLCYSVSAFAHLDELIVVCREEDEETIKKLLSPFPHAKTCLGGATRAESVYNGLKASSGDIVLVHDAARPFVTKKIIDDCLTSIKTHGSGVCALPATDTTVLVENGKITSVPPRAEVFTVQTPQGFYRDKLLSAYEKALNDGAEAFTDDSGLYLKYAESPALFLGSRENRKLTYREDFTPCERVGFGVDTHAFAYQEEYEKGIARLILSYITLGGVKIPSNRPLLAHSDGDVLVHALMDALLSAAGLRDIGYYFPDTDEKYKGACSMNLLKEVLTLVAGAGFAVKNVSLSILAESPRLSPYIERMKKNLSEVLELPENAIGIAAGTNEKLGYIGEGKGITCYATVLLKDQG